MALIKTESPIQSISGKLCKADSVVFYKKRGNRNFAWKNSGPTGEPSPAQIANREKFKAVNLLVATDMESPETMQQWQEVADNSKTKFATARGAAFSYHWDNYEPEVVE